MSPFRILVLLALGWLVWRLLRRALQPPAETKRNRPDDALTLTRCERCGTYIPQSPGSTAAICERCRSK
jgi:hypothetical protein